MVIMLLRKLFTEDEYYLLVDVLKISSFWRVDNSYPKQCLPFHVSDFREIRNAHVDMSTDEHIICVLGVLKDNRWFIITGGVDDEGVLWGEVNNAQNKEVLLAFGVTDYERSLLRI